MFTRLRFFRLLIFPLLILFGCNGEKMETEKMAFLSIKDVPDSTWRKLSEKRIYFGHQSVGFNIIAGIEDVMKENPQIKLNIVETTDPSALNTPAFFHSKVGKNTDPKSKCDAFSDLMEKGIGGKVGIALLKLCYVDVRADTDVDRVFNEYKSTFSSLRTKFPKTTFVHMTIPLTTVQTGVKAFIKNIMGKELDGYAENIKRELLNTKLRTEYAATEPLFDLAQLESTFADGARSTFLADGKTYYSMVPEYTNDGGHLNEKGRRVIAEHLLVLLANQAS